MGKVLAVIPLDGVATSGLIDTLRRWDIGIYDSQGRCVEGKAGLVARDFEASFRTSSELVDLCSPSQCKGKERACRA